MQEMKISMLEKENYELSNKSVNNTEKNQVLESNLKRFEEERRQFEMEKLKFLEEKRELDRIRLQRFERYKRELEAKRLGLKPNYDIDNPNDYMVARKVVIDYKANEGLMLGQAVDSESESEPEVTVVENVAKNEEAPEVEKEPPEKEAEAVKDESPENTQNNKELANGTEKPNDTTKPSPVSEKEENAQKIHTIEIDEKNPMKLWQFCKLLFIETRQIWTVHKRQHSKDWLVIKHEFKKCMSELLMLMIFCGIGGVILHYIEGNFEANSKTGVKRVKRDFIDQLWLSSHNLRYRKTYTHDA